MEEILVKILTDFFGNDNVHTLKDKTIRVRPMWVEPPNDLKYPDIFGYQPSMSEMFEQVITALEFNGINQSHGYTIEQFPRFSYIKVNDYCIIIYHDYF